MAAGLLPSVIVSPLSAWVITVCVGCVVAVLKIFRREGDFKKIILSGWGRHTLTTALVCAVALRGCGMCVTAAWAHFAFSFALSV